MLKRRGGVATGVATAWSALTSAAMAQAPDVANAPTGPVIGTAALPRDLSPWEGCTEVQGYLFSPPRPAAKVKGLLASINPKLKAIA